MNISQRFFRFPALFVVVSSSLPAAAGAEVAPGGLSTIHRRHRAHAQGSSSSGAGAEAVIVCGSLSAPHKSTTVVGIISIFRGTPMAIGMFVVATSLTVTGFPGRISCKAVARWPLPRTPWPSRRRPRSDRLRGSSWEGGRGRNEPGHLRDGVISGAAAFLSRDTRRRGILVGYGGAGVGTFRP